MAATRRSSRFRKRARSGLSGPGARPACGATSCRCRIIAALSVMTSPSGVTSVGTCPSGFRCSSRSRSGPGCRYGTSVNVCGTLASTSAISTTAEPQPADPISS
ncbi:hypothetical protein G6F61_014865 [Rhizopus arrhizus]|nr:hypothetical protein G6F61_014865 [Rhizopus arrhizus]